VELKTENIKQKMEKERKPYVDLTSRRSPAIEASNVAQQQPNPAQNNDS
jgi:hypothetical protein